MLVVVHGLQFTEHAFFDGMDKCLDLCAREILFLEPVDDRERAARLQEPVGGSKEIFAVLIVGDGFHRPQNVELLLEVHCLGVHQEELDIEPLPCRSRGCHFDLYWGNSYARDGGVIVFRQIKTAGTDAAANVKNI